MDNHQPDVNPFDRQFFGDPHSFRQQFGNFGMAPSGLNIPPPFSSQMYSSLGRRSSFNTHEVTDHLSPFASQRSANSLASPTVQSPHVSMPSSPWLHPFHSQNMQTDEFQMGYSPGLINPRMNDIHQDSFLSNQRSHFFGSHFPADTQLFQQREMQLHQAQLREAQIRREQELHREREAQFLREREEKMRQEQEAQLQREAMEREAQLQRERQMQREKEAQAKREQELQLQQQREREIKMQQQQMQIQQEKAAALQKEKEAEIQRQHQMQLQRSREYAFYKSKEPQPQFNLNSLKDDNSDLLSNSLVHPRKTENHAPKEIYHSEDDLSKLFSNNQQPSNLSNTSSVSDIFFPSSFQNSFSQISNNMPNLSNSMHPYSHSKLVFPDMAMPVLSKQTSASFSNETNNPYPDFSLSSFPESDSKTSTSFQDPLLKNIGSNFREKTFDISFPSNENSRNLDDIDLRIDEHLSVLQEQGNKSKISSDFGTDSLLNSAKFSELFNGVDPFKLPENSQQPQDKQFPEKSAQDIKAVKENQGSPITSNKIQFNSAVNRNSQVTQPSNVVPSSNLSQPVNTTLSMLPSHHQSQLSNVKENKLSSPKIQDTSNDVFSPDTKETSNIKSQNVAVEKAECKTSIGNYDMSRVLSPPFTSSKSEYRRTPKTSFSIESFLGISETPAEKALSEKAKEEKNLANQVTPHSVTDIQNKHQDRISVIKPVASVASIEKTISSHKEDEPTREDTLTQKKKDNTFAASINTKSANEHVESMRKPLHPSMRFKSQTEKIPEASITENKSASSKLLHPSMRLKRNSQSSQPSKNSPVEETQFKVASEPKEKNCVPKKNDMINAIQNKGKPTDYAVPSGKPLSFSSSQKSKIASYNSSENLTAKGKPLSFLKTQSPTSKTASVKPNTTLTSKPSTNNSWQPKSAIDCKPTESSSSMQKSNEKLPQEQITSTAVLKKKPLVPPGKPLTLKGKLTKEKPVSTTVTPSISKPKTFTKVLPASSKNTEPMEFASKAVSKVNESEKKLEATDSDLSDSDDGSSSSGDEVDATMVVDENVDETTGSKRKASEEAELIAQLKKRKIVDEELIKIPLQHGWRRETRLRANGPSDGLRGDVYYYSPCGKKLRTYPELNNQILKEKNSEVKLEYFSFSTKLKVGEFTEAKDGTVVETLTEEQVKERFDRVYEKERLLQEKAVKRKEYQKEKLEQAKKLQEEKQKKKLQMQAMKKARDEEKKKLAEKKAMELRLKKEKEAEAAKEAKRLKEEAIMLRKMQKKAAVEAMRIAKEEKVQRSIAEKQKLKENKEKARLMKIEQQKLEKEWKQQAIENERERLKEQKRLEKIIEKQRKLEQKRYERLVNKELKKPIDDLALKDLKPLPDVPKIPKLNICGKAYADLLMVQEFIHSFGHVLDIDPKEDFPTLGELQSALLCESSNEVDILFSVCQLLLDFAVVDPGVNGKFAKTSLGVELKNVELTEGNISEMLRLFILCRNDNKRSLLSDLLSTKTLACLSPSNKAGILAFLCNELLCGKAIGREIEANLDAMANLRKEKWTLEGQMRKLKQDISRKKPKQTLIQPISSSSRLTEDDRDNDSNNSDDETSSQEFRHIPQDLLMNEGLTSNENTNDAPILNEKQEKDEHEKKLRQMERKHAKYRIKLFEASHAVRGIHLGQDRYKRRYYTLPNGGGIYIEGLESGYFDENINKFPDSPNMNIDHLNKTQKYSSVDKKYEPSYNINQVNISTHSNSETLQANIQSLITASKSINNLNSPNNYLKSPQRTIMKDPSNWFSLSKKCKRCEEPARRNPYIQPSNSNKNLHLVPPKYSELGNDHMFLESVYSFYVPQNSMFSFMHTNSLTPSTNHQTSFPDTTLNSSNISISQLTQSIGIDFNLLIKKDPQKAAEILEMQSAVPREIPENMTMGWWKINDAESVHKLLKSAHPRAVRERTLQKTITRQIDYTIKSCQQENTSFSLAIPEDETENKDDSRLQAPISSFKDEEISDHWYPQMAFANDKSLLMEVEDLEEKMFSASLQAKGLRLSQKLSSSIHFDPSKHYEESGCTSQLVLDAAAKLLTLEAGIERRYLNHPFTKVESAETGKDDALKNSNLQGTTPALLTWRKAVSEATSASQLSMCINQLNECIAWEKSIMKVFCILCRKSDNEERLLLCDRCDRGCHTYCCKPKLEKIPDGDWFCQECILMASGSDHCYKCKGKNGKRLKCAFCPRYYHMQCVEPPLHKTPRQPWACPVCKKARSKSKPPAKKKPRVEEIVKKDIVVNKQKSSLKLKMDKEVFQLCERMLRDLENHKLSWPFLTPVNGKQFPEYYKVIRHPMDFGTMKTKLFDSTYRSKDEFAHDARLVFKNCNIFNEDDSEVGLAGKAMCQFFERRWKEVLSSTSDTDNKVSLQKDESSRPLVVDDQNSSCEEEEEEIEETDVSDIGSSDSECSSSSESDSEINSSPIKKERFS